MLNERPEGKDKFGYVLIGLLVAFVIILVTSAVILFGLWRLRPSGRGEKQASLLSQSVVV